MNPKELEVEKKRVSKYHTYYTLYGSMTITNSTNLVNMICREIVEQYIRNITLDMREVKYIDSFGIGGLMKCNTVMKDTKDSSAKLEILISENLFAKLSTAGLDKMLDLKVME